MRALLLLALIAPVRAERSATWDRAKEVRAEAPLAPTPGHRVALRTLVTDLLRAAPAGRVPDSAADRAASLGLSLEVEGDRLWLAEAPPGGRGNGLLAVRLGPLQAEVVVQAPHPFHDEDTGAIAGKLLDDLHAAEPDLARGGIRAVVLATAQRYAGEELDPTRQVAHLLQAMTDAVPEALVDPLVVQLHGYAEGTTEADGVVSVGLSRAGRRLEGQARTVLAEALAAPDLRGPEEVPELAALANVQGRLLAERARFLHMELSPALRDRLRRDAALRDRLRRALVALASTAADAPEPAP